MWRAIMLGVVVLTLVLPVGRGQSLPSKARCRVDEQYFGAQVQRDLLLKLQRMSDPRATFSEDEIPAKELDARIKEMTSCIVVDQANLRNYEEATSTFQSDIEIRENDFIRRHHMLSEFYAEDSRGLR